MTAPRRWKDSPDAPIGVRELFAASKPRRPLDDRAYRRGAERVAKMGVAPAIGVTAAIWAKLAAAGAVGLVAAGALVAVELEHGRGEPSVSVARALPPRSIASPSLPSAARATEPTSSGIREPEPASDSKANPPPARAPSFAGAPVATAKPASQKGAEIVGPATNAVAASGAGAPAPEAAVSGAPAQPSQASTLAAELSFLEEARAHLAHDPETALRHLSAHRARYPRGVLASERDLVELDALRRAGRVEDARIRARSWLERDPSGLHAARVRRILASLDAPR